MRLLKNKNNYNFSKDVCNLDYKVKFKNIKRALLIIIIPSLIPIISMTFVLGYGGFVFGTLISMLYSIPMGILTTTLLLTQHSFYKRALKKAKSIIKENELNINENDLKNCDVLEIATKKDKITLKDGNKAKRKKVTDYIVINKNQKLKIIRQITKNIKRGFYKSVETKIELLNDKDLLNEGLITENGKLTEKAKTLGLSIN